LGEELCKAIEDKVVQPHMVTSSGEE